jgi:hypothetical protein
MRIRTSTPYDSFVLFLEINTKKSNMFFLIFLFYGLDNQYQKCAGLYRWVGLINKTLLAKRPSKRRF